MADRAQAPLQFNRPSTKARPQDPCRFESHDALPADAQEDPEYRKMVQDIEALQQRQGWLAGRGAFDKDDLLYLKHKQEEERVKEQEQRDSETAAFAAAKARAALQEQESATASFKLSVKQFGKQQVKTGPLQPVLRVKAHGNKAHAPQHHQQDQPGEGPEAKRPKLAATNVAVHTDGQHRGGGAQLHGGNIGTKTIPTKVPAMAAVTGTQQPPGQQTQGVAALAAAAAAAPMATELDKDPSSGLQGLLCDYGSDDDDDKSVSRWNSQPAQQPVTQPQRLQQQVKKDSPFQLPPAEELLAQDLSVNGFAKAHKQQSHALAEAVGDLEEDNSSNQHRSAHQGQGSWI